MDAPLTRREKKKDQRKKAGEKDGGKYSQKHIREVERLKEKKSFR